MKPHCCKSKSKAEREETLHYLKVISEEKRLKILCMLKEGEKCVCDIYKFLGVSQNLVSHHLKTLKDFELVSSRKEGLKVYYTLNKKNLNYYTKLLNNFLKI